MNEVAAVVCVPGPPREGATRVEDDEQPTVKQGVPETIAGATLC